MEVSAQSLVSNVGQLVGAEFRQLRGVGGEVARLRNELATINALLRMQSEGDDAAVDHFVRVWMKQLREVAYDAEDCVHLYIFRVRSRPGDRFFVRCKRLLTTLWSRHLLAGDIRDLRALASAINEQHARYGVSLEPLRRTAVQASARPLLRQATDNDDDGNNHQLVGIESLAVELADKVKEPKNEPKVLSTWGFGGLGKTTLAGEVCRLLETEFPHQAQVSVSQTFSGKQDLQGLLQRLLRQIGQPKHTTAASNEQANRQGDNIDAMDVAELESELKQCLDNNRSRCLILVDDVWSIQTWDAIRSKIRSSNCSSRIIVTTRVHTVAKACSDPNDIHCMKELNKKDSEQLFVSKAFGSAGKPCPNDEDLKATMTSILNKCGGLPLAIVSIGSLLASYKPPEGKEMWRLVERSIGSQMEMNPTLEGMRQILTLSYDHLPHHLKNCMMYLSIFPEDTAISKERLLKRWVAEGLVAEKRGLTQMEVAEDYFNELMSRSMIDKATDSVSIRREERCRVHDMMLEIMVSKSLEANFVSLVGGQYAGLSYTNTIRRLSIHGGVEAHNKGASSSKKNNGTGNNGIINGMMVQHVRSLSIFDPEVNNNRLLARLGEFTLLRVLDLEDCKGLGERHMRCICWMYLLRFLSLKGTDIKVMPPRFGDLEHLQTLDVRETHLKKLPETAKKLEKLEHLLFFHSKHIGLMDSVAGWMLPHGISKMKALRQLNLVEIRDPEVVEEIGELDRLQELAVVLVSGRSEDVAEKFASSLSKLYSLRWLRIIGSHLYLRSTSLNFLHGVKPPPRLLRYLNLYGPIDRLPDWVESLTDLVEFEIMLSKLDHVDKQLFDVLYKLPNLKMLTLGSFFAEPSSQGIRVGRSSQPFQNLKKLTLDVYNHRAHSTYIFEEGSMPKLETLVVNYGQWWTVIIGIEHLMNLKEVVYKGGSDKRGMERAVEQLEELNKKREEPKQIAVRVNYYGRVWD